MTDHADTIRRAISGLLAQDSWQKPLCIDAVQALDALLAERQQAIDERDAAVLLAQRLVEFIEHTRDNYGERMASQWKTHARSLLEDAALEQP